MVARMYRLASNLTKEQNAYLAGLKGQAKVVAEELKADTTPRLAETIDGVCGKKFVTRQSTLRVTLYYVIIFKGKGIVEAIEPAKTVAPTETVAPAGLLSILNAQA